MLLALRYHLINSAVQIVLFVLVTCLSLLLQHPHAPHAVVPLSLQAWFEHLVWPDGVALTLFPDQDWHTLPTVLTHTLAQLNGSAGATAGGEAAGKLQQEGGHNTAAWGEGEGEGEGEGKGQAAEERVRQGEGEEEWQWTAGATEGRTEKEKGAIQGSVAAGSSRKLLLLLESAAAASGRKRGGKGGEQGAKEGQKGGGNYEQPAGKQAAFDKLRGSAGGSEGTGSNKGGSEGTSSRGVSQGAGSTGSSGGTGSSSQKEQAQGFAWVAVLDRLNNQGAEASPVQSAGE